MLLSLVLTVLLALPPWLEAIVQGFRPGARVGLPALQIIIAYLAFNLACVAMVAYLETRAKRDPPKHLRH